MSSSRDRDADHLVNGMNEMELSTSTMKLCSICKNLNLSPESFIIDTQSSLSLEGCAPNSYLPRERSQFSLKSRSSKVSFGTLKDITYRSATCSLCALVSESTVSPHTAASYKTSDVENAKCFLNWEIDGRESALGSRSRVRGRTRRIHLLWDSGLLEDSYLVFVAPEKYMRPNSDAQFVWKDEALFLGREIHSEGGNKALVKSWLDLCLDSHHGPCKATSNDVNEFTSMISASYFGVIDVLDLCLTSLPFESEEDEDSGATTTVNSSRRSETTRTTYSSDWRGRNRGRRDVSPQSTRPLNHEPYVTLSYVWGTSTKPYTTQLSNIMLHRKHGGLEKVIRDLPQALQDAIQLVRDLGIRYIWIDSLCIVQDSNRSWSLNARAMDLIYGESLLTICAADGIDASAGLRATHYQGHEVVQPQRDVAPGVRLMISRPPEVSIKASTWNSRAWTFQERLLSKRCLIFTEGRIYFQCRSTGMSEDIFADRKGAGWSLDLVNAPLQLLRALESRALWVYLNCVALYTSRQLTKLKDILAAFEGIMHRMQETLQAPFIFGLPSSHFDLAMLWEPSHALERRVYRSPEEKSEYNGLELPSWSWSGWMEGRAEYKTGMVEGCLSDVHRWLTKHTWISWHIRDGHGNLRPLWDVERAPQDRSTHKRWKGYMTNKDCFTGQGDGPHDEIYVSKRQRIHPFEVDNEAGERHRNSLYYGYGDLDEDDFITEERHERPPLRARADYGRGDYIDYARIDYRENPRRDQARAENARAERAPLAIATTEDMWTSDKSHGKKNRFKLTLPENPYRVVMTEYKVSPDKEFPDQPILQFWTWHTMLHVLAVEESSSSSSSSSSRESLRNNGLCRHDIADEAGDWCGSLVLPETWARSHQNHDLKHNFIAISEAKAFTEDECELWTYYIPKEREQSEWDLYFVLLLERVGNKWERVALGKVFKAAFANKKWKEIILG